MSKSLTRTRPPGARSARQGARTKHQQNQEEETQDVPTVLSKVEAGVDRPPDGRPSPEVESQEAAHDDLGEPGADMASPQADALVFAPDPVPGEEQPQEGEEDGPPSEMALELMAVPHLLHTEGALPDGLSEAEAIPQAQRLITRGEVQTAEEAIARILASFAPPPPLRVVKREKKATAPHASTLDTPPPTGTALPQDEETGDIPPGTRIVVDASGVYRIQHEVEGHYVDYRTVKGSVEWTKSKQTAGRWLRDHAIIEGTYTPPKALTRARADAQTPEKAAPTRMNVSLAELNTVNAAILIGAQIVLAPTETTAFPRQVLLVAKEPGVQQPGGLYRRMTPGEDAQPDPAFPSPALLYITPTEWAEIVRQAREVLP